MPRKLMASRGAFEDKNKGMISQDRVEEERLLTGGQLNYVCLPSISVRLPGVFTVPFLPAVIRGGRSRGLLLLFL